MRQVLISLITLFAFALGGLSPWTSEPPPEAEVVVKAASRPEPLARPVLVEVALPQDTAEAPAAAMPKPAAAAKATAPKATQQAARAAATPHVHEQAATAARGAPAPRPAPAKATAKPEPAPKATRAPANASYDKEKVKAQIREAWPGNDDEAIAVVGCETGGTFNPRTISSNGLYKGLWQFHQDTWERWGGSGDPRDASPAVQTRIAWNGYQANGWNPWPSCRPS